MVAQNLSVDTIDRGPIGDVGHIDGHANEFIEPGTGSFQDMVDVCQCLMCLCLGSNRNGRCRYLR